MFTLGLQKYFVIGLKSFFLILESENWWSESSKSWNLNCYLTLLINSPNRWLIFMRNELTRNSRYQLFQWSKKGGKRCWLDGAMTRRIFPDHSKLKLEASIWKPPISMTYQIINLYWIFVWLFPNSLECSVWKCLASFSPLKNKFWVFDFN